jgi:hypothetical protein
VEQISPYAIGLLPQAVQQALSAIADALSKGFDGALTGAGQVLPWLGWPPEPTGSPVSWALIAAYSAWFVLAAGATTFAAGLIAFLLAPKSSLAPLPDEKFSGIRGKPSPDP